MIWSYGSFFNSLLLLLRLFDLVLQVVIVPILETTDIYHNNLVIICDPSVEILYIFTNLGFQRFSNYLIKIRVETVPLLLKAYLNILDLVFKLCFFLCSIILVFRQIVVIQVDNIFLVLTLDCFLTTINYFLVYFIKA